MLRCQFSRGVITVRLDLQAIGTAIGPAVRGALVILLDVLTWGMHPSSPYQPILLRQRLQVPV